MPLAGTAARRRTDEHAAREGRRRVVIEGVAPEVDGGASGQRTVGETLVVEADAFTDGHDAVRAGSPPGGEGDGRGGTGAAGWRHAPMRPGQRSLAR